MNKSFRKIHIHPEKRMFRKTAVIILIISAVFAGCSENRTRYSEAKKFIRDYTEALTDYRNDIKEAEDAKGITAAIDTLSIKISDLSKEKARIEKKYPELALPGSGPVDVPEELKKEYSDFHRNQQETKAATRKMMYTYMSNKRVVNAMMKLSKKLSNFN